MQVEVSKRAQRQWLRILIYYNEMGGQRAAANLHQKYLKKQDRLLMHPKSGFPEPLLSDRKILYRASDSALLIITPPRFMASLGDSCHL